MSGIEIFDEANKRYVGFDRHIFLSALIGSLTVLVDDEEIWRKAIRTTDEFMETHMKQKEAANT